MAFRNTFNKLSFVVLIACAVALWVFPLDRNAFAEDSNASITQQLEKPVSKALTADEAVRLLAAKYEARLDALEQNNKTFDQILRYGGAVAGLVIAFFAFLGWRNINAQLKLANDVAKDALNSAKASAEEAIEQKWRSFLDTEKSSKEVLKEAKSIVEELDKLKAEVSWHEEFSDDIKAAEGFDPLVDYFELASEIEDRHEKNMARSRGDNSVNVEDTIHDRTFRRKASLVFQKLLESVREGEKDKDKRRIDPVSLFNAAANASKVDMDFVALELMEVANQMANGTWLDELLNNGKKPEHLRAPEIASRLIRQRLNMVRISPEDAKKAIAAVLEITNEMDLHLVVSEAFNVGVYISDPAGMADIIQDSLREELRSVSYVLFNNARLKFMSGLEESASDGKELFKQGLEAFAKEPPTARWYEHSTQELARILHENPALAEENKSLIK